MRQQSLILLYILTCSLSPLQAAPSWWSAFLEKAKPVYDSTYFGKDPQRFIYCATGIVTALCAIAAIRHYYDYKYRTRLQARPVGGNEYRLELTWPDTRRIVVGLEHRMQMRNLVGTALAEDMSMINFSNANNDLGISEGNLAYFNFLQGIGLVDLRSTAHDHLIKLLAQHWNEVNRLNRTHTRFTLKSSVSMTSCCPPYIPNPPPRKFAITSPTDWVELPPEDQGGQNIPHFLCVQKTTTPPTETEPFWKIKFQISSKITPQG